MLGAGIATKTCSKCRKEKSIDEFPFKDAQSGKRHSVCKKCVAKGSKEWYAQNREVRTSQIAERRLASRAEARQYVLDYLLSHPCVDCGETDHVVLDFDHVRGLKARGISVMVQLGYPLETIKAEIARCEVRCANCHRIKTAERRSQRRLM
jgi:hypothetical protein